MRFADNLRASRGVLATGKGVPVHAASFLRQRLIVLDRELLAAPSELKRIWIHELLHFVWWRLNNRQRRSWELLLSAERCGGELGWSAEWRKRLLTMTDKKHRTRKWREYCCESFCDTGAWLLTGKSRHPEATLPASASSRRSRWWPEVIRYNPE